MSERRKARGRLVGRLLSPKGLLTRAAMLALVFLLCHAAGLREYTSVLSGTVPAGATGRVIAVGLAALYLFSYFAFVLLVPVMVLASPIMLGLLLLGDGHPPQRGGRRRCKSVPI